LLEQLRMILHRMQTASLCPDDRPIAFAVSKSCRENIVVIGA